MNITRTIFCMALATTVACSASDNNVIDTKARNDLIERYTKAQDALYVNVLLYASNFSDVHAGSGNRKFRAFADKTGEQFTPYVAQLRISLDKAKRAYALYPSMVNTQLDASLPMLPAAINGIITGYYQEPLTPSANLSPYGTPLRRFNVTIPALTYANIHMGILSGKCKGHEFGFDEIAEHIKILPSETVQPIMKELEEQIISLNSNAQYWQKQIDNLPQTRRAAINELRQIQQGL